MTAWYWKSASYLSGTSIRAAFVSTNSISQGQQVSVLWAPLLAAGVQIDFAHTTFAWRSEARGAAHVHVVIIGFSFSNRSDKSITEYSLRRSQDELAEVVGTKHSVTNISPYLFEGANVLVHSRSKPISPVPSSIYGSKPTDGGFLIVEEEDRKAFLASSKAASKYLRPLLCADEYLDNIPRWCIWLDDAPPNEWRHDAALMERVSLVRDFRLKSKKLPTQEAALSPSTFAEIRQPKSQFLVVTVNPAARYGGAVLHGA